MNIKRVIREQNVIQKRAKSLFDRKFAWRVSLLGLRNRQIYYMNLLKALRAEPAAKFYRRV